MFDSASAAILRSAPAIEGLDPESLPALLTRHYARLASSRLTGQPLVAGGDDDWTLERIADTYELITALVEDREARGPAAFVAATAHQIIARHTVQAPDHIQRPVVDRDTVDSTLSAALLFLAAEQYADANEAAGEIPPGSPDETYEATILAENIRDLARGKLHEVVDRGTRWRRARRNNSIEQQALAALLEGLTCGLELFASSYLRLDPPPGAAGRFENHTEAFRHVLRLSAASRTDERFGAEYALTYSGPNHLAALLVSATDGIADASLLSVPPPDGASKDVWSKWLHLRAKSFPFVWRNHRSAIHDKFHETGVSAVVVLPTGAGKTTISSLKIAGVLARGKKVIFLAPTHALVEQLTVDLQEMFPSEQMGAVVSSDFDLLLQEDASFQDIEVMTPERCLAMLSFAPEAFNDVGLLVFDECHLLSPEAGKIRRSVDGMLCVLAFNKIVHDADFLLLSAMLSNGDELSKWLIDLTGRPSVSVDLLWKPSRQARGVIIYREEDLDRVVALAYAKHRALNKKSKKQSKSLRTGAQELLVAQPRAIWGLQHNWLSGTKAQCVTTDVLPGTVALTGVIDGGSIRLTPNANEVAANIAAAAAQHRIKTIVFVNTKADAVRTAREIARAVVSKIVPTLAEQERWEALEVELGDLKHSVVPSPASAVPHNSAMLRLERDLAERLFKRPDGAEVIVATPTLAQGLNLPAQLALIAGDRRADPKAKGKRKALEAHEILNAAARAGRAGHLANGLVLLVPEPLISRQTGKPLTMGVVNKLKAVLPEDDHCVTVTDPLEKVLDRLMQGNVTDPDVRYTVNRMVAMLEAGDGEPLDNLFDLRKSFAAYQAAKRKDQAVYERKLDALRVAVAEQSVQGLDKEIAILVSRSGLSPELLHRIKIRLESKIGSLPTTVADWVSWTVDWLHDDDEAREDLMEDSAGAVLSAHGETTSGEMTATHVWKLLPGVLAWIAGEPIREIELALGGEPDHEKETKRLCPRARALVGTLIPRSLCYSISLVAHVVGKLDLYQHQENLDRRLIETLGTAVRRGFDTPEKLSFAASQPGLLSRVQVHRAWKARQDEMFEGLI